MLSRTFNYWTVLSESPPDIGDPNKKYLYCQCVCCRKRHVREDDLKSGKSKSCGCSRSLQLLNIVGQKFNHWTVLSIGKIINTHRYVKCRCDCGFIADLRFSAIKQNQSKSCGCTRAKRNRDINYQQTQSQKVAC